ncbi:MAG: LuxR C-terminal-related transcriptional regulator [Clostridiales bacterium]|nr:LuxR C-terminal-related transcriptional regulator [Clostridiales bacterium]
MRRRLLVFLLLLTFIMLAGLVIVISLLGVFPANIPEAEKLFSNELGHLSSNMIRQFGGASVQAARMSERLAAGVTAFMRREGISPGSLAAHPEYLEPLLREQLPILLSSLDTTECSGVFFALDATVNPDILGAGASKAGLYIRNIEPNIGGMGIEVRHLLRGSPSLAGDGSLNLQAKWDLEFDVEGQSYWRAPIAAYRSNPELPLSRLVYWSSMSPVQGLNEDVMVCSIPVLDNDGNVIGVCGFEISEMNFMLRYEPVVSGYHHTVYLLTAARGGSADLAGALYSGHNAVYGAFPAEGEISIIEKSGGLCAFSLPGGGSYVGKCETLRLYPEDSPFAAQAYVAALLVTKEDFDAGRAAENLRLGLILSVLAAMGIAASVVFSGRYAQPITDRLAAAAGGGIPEKTNIVEIDALIDRIRELHSKSSPLPDNLFEDFIARVKTLTPTELSVFRYYAQDKTAEEITDIMFVTTNTLKTHNRHIYAKLGVSSRDEIMLYVELIKRSGLEGEIL